MISVPKYQRVYFLPLSSMAAADITSSYTALGDPFDRPVRQIRISNLTDKDMLISFDGITDHLCIKAGNSDPWDFTTNTIPDYRFFLDELTQVYVKYVEDPSTGSIYFSAVGNVL